MKAMKRQGKASAAGRDTRPPAAPPMVAEFARNCIQYVQNAMALRLDFEPETLSILDHYGALARDVKVKSEAEREDLLMLLASLMGCYFGEVIRRSYRCRWSVRHPNPCEWRLEFLDCFLYFNPVGVAMEVMLDDHAEGWGSGFGTLPDDMAELSESLDRIPGVAPADFFRFTTRWDTLAYIVDWLVSRYLAPVARKRRLVTTEAAYRKVIDQGL